LFSLSSEFLESSKNFIIVIIWRFSEGFHINGCSSSFCRLVNSMILVLGCKLYVFFNKLFFSFAIKFEINSLCVFREEGIIETFNEVSFGHSLQGFNRVLLFAEIVFMRTDLTPRSDMHFCKIDVFLSHNSVYWAFDKLKIFIRDLFNCFFDFNHPLVCGMKAVFVWVLSWLNQKDCSLNTLWRVFSMVNNITKLLSCSKLIEIRLRKILWNNFESQFSFKIIISDICLIISNECWVVVFRILHIKCYSHVTGWVNNLRWKNVIYAKWLNWESLFLKFNKTFSLFFTDVSWN